MRADDEPAGRPLTCQAGEQQQRQQQTGGVMNHGAADGPNNYTHSHDYARSYNEY